MKNRNRRTRNEKQLQAAARKALAGIVILFLSGAFFLVAAVRACAICAW